VLPTLAIVLLPATALAELPPPAPTDGKARTAGRFEDGPWHTEVLLGFGTLVGSAGIAIGYNVDERVELGAGVGTNFLGPIGGPYARFRPLMGITRGGRLHAMSLDTGISMGRYEDVFDGVFDSMSHRPPEEDPDYESDYAMWAQIELSWETWSVGGFTLRIGNGAAILLNPEALDCDVDPEFQSNCDKGGRMVPVYTIGLGHVF
jgi:hypothetical protein